MSNSINISGAQYTTRNTMYIILRLKIRYAGIERYISYREIQNLNIPGISFVNVLCESSKPISIVPTIVYQDKPIHKYIMSNDINGEELAYTKDVFDYIKKELLPFSKEHMNDFGLYLYTDLYFNTKKTNISEFEPVDKVLEANGILNIANKNVAKGIKVESANNMEDLLKSLEVQTEKVQTVDEITAEQTINTIPRQTKQHSTDSQQSQYQPNEQSDNTEHVQTTDALRFQNTKQDESIKFITDLPYALENTVLTKYNEVKTHFFSTDNIDDIRDSYGWLAVNYLEDQYRCPRSGEMPVKSLTTSYIRTCEAISSLRLFSSMYKVQIQSNLKKFNPDCDQEEAVINQILGYIRDITAECKTALLGTSNERSAIIQKDIQSLRSLFSITENSTTPIRVRPLDNSATIVLKYLVRHLQACKGINFMSALGDQATLKILCEVYKYSINSLSVNQDIRKVLEFQENGGHYMAWRTLINSMITNLRQ